MKPIEDLLGKFKEDVWEERDDAWKTSEDIKDQINQAIDKVKMPAAIKDNLKKEIQQL